MKKFLANKYFWIIFVFGVVGFTFALKERGREAGESGGESARLGVVKRQDLIQRVTVAGNVIPLKKTVISAPYNGYIQKIFVKMGQLVKANDPVVSITESLHGRRDEIYPIRAPFTGTVVQILKTEGEYVETGKDTSAIVRIDDMTRYLVVVDVPESEIGKIKIGQETRISAPAVLTRTYKGTIQEISLAAKDKQGSSRTGDRVEFTIKMEVIDKDQQILSGMSVIVDIVTAKRSNVLTLRQEYVQKNDHQYSVVLENGKIKEIKVGLMNEDSMEIIEGLSEGDRVRMLDFLSLAKDAK